MHIHTYIRSMYRRFNILITGVELVSKDGFEIIRNILGIHILHMYTYRYVPYNNIINCNAAGRVGKKYFVCATKN